MKPIVSIITINFNGLHDTCAMIESLKQHETYPYEVIVVDNGSKQDEASVIAEQYPEVKVVRNENTGFAGGNNVGLRLAEGEYIAHDSLLPCARQATIRRLYRAYRHHPSK